MTVVVGLVLCCAASALAEERKEPLPTELAGVGITEHLGAQIPMDLEFVNSDGKPIKLGDCFQPDKPAILTLVYYRCPMLCSLVLNGLLDGLRDVPLTAGVDFNIITVSFDPRETPQLAQLNKQNHVKEYGRPQAAKGWYFLTGKEKNIKQLAETVGFGYTFVESRQEYAHSAGIFLLMPDGRISRYLYGIKFDSPTLRLALTEAGKGKVGSTVDRILLSCFHFDAEAGKYSVAAFKVMQFGGVVTVLILGALLTPH
jgi:protein SCO1